MSKAVAKKTYLIATTLGNIALREELIQDYDVEDVVRGKAESQARLIQMINVGKELVGNPNFPSEVLPTVFKDSEDF